MPDTKGVATQPEKSYPALLWLNIKSRKSEFFGGLLLSIATSCGTVWLQYRDGMLEQKHFWDGIVTSAVPVFGIVVIFALVEVYRAAASLHREAQTEIKELRAAQPQLDSRVADRVSVMKLATEIAQFVAMRRAVQPPRALVIAARTFTEEPSASQLRFTEHTTETAKQYAALFLARVNQVCSYLTSTGIDDAELTQANMNPALAENMQVISDRLKEIAIQLPDNQVSGVVALLEASTRHENSLAALGAQLSYKDEKIAVLEAQIAIDRPRDIPLEQRLRITKNLLTLIPLSERKSLKGETLWVVSLANSSDSQYLARAVADILRPCFKVTLDHESSVNISRRYTQDDLSGLVLMLPTSPRTFGRHGDIIIDAFKAEGIEIRQDQATRFPDVFFMVLLVGRRA